MRKTLLPIFILLITISSFAQNLITGKITDAQTGTPVAGATVSANGTKSATISQNDGSFSIKVDANVKLLTVSFIGYNSTEVNVSNSPVNISLVQGTRALNEVVVVGYGTKIRKDITGSVSQVNAKQITNTPATSFETAIQGRAAGVFVEQQNGKLGQAINVTIRGGSSVTAGNQPLYVVDGIPVTAKDLSGNGSSTNSLSDINMNDIASIEILKDASSAAIYGSRASNGVVLITTKKGKAGTSKIEFNYFTGSQKPTGKREFLNSKQYVDFFEQAALGAANVEYNLGYYNTLKSAQNDWTSYTAQGIKK